MELVCLNKHGLWLVLVWSEMVCSFGIIAIKVVKQKMVKPSNKIPTEETNLLNTLIYHSWLCINLIPKQKLLSGLCNSFNVSF